ncbi:hypothetical protein QL285_015915 [Trifolium repens]|nr:hypothetical protein QL285_015915 [Trifolium repens]
MTEAFLVALLCFSSDRSSFATLGKLSLTFTLTLLSFVLIVRFPKPYKNLNHSYNPILVLHVDFMDFGEGSGSLRQNRNATHKHSAPLWPFHYFQNP